VIEANLDDVLKLLGLTVEEAEGPLPLTTLVRWTEEIEAERGREWVEQNARSLREQWLYIQSM